MKTPLVRARAIHVAAACLGLTLLLGACGSQTAGTASTPKPTPTNGIANKRPAEIVKATKQALASATSVHIRGNVRESGHHYTVDMVLGTSTAKGNMTGPIAGVKHASFDFLVTGGKMYFRSSTLWSKLGMPAVSSMLNGRWVLMPKSSVKGFPFANSKAFVHALGSAGKARSVGAPTTIDGQPAVTVTTSDSIIYVATTGQPYPLRVAARNNKQGSGAVDFLDYNAPLVITPPQNPVDLTKLHA